ncbi:MAG: shikimate kinase, partial [Alphaproteobacteria bacterium]|nr:shikimate kinase [Alphaproteobacteria bacterium]
MPSMSLTRTVALIGMMGAGKTKVGRMLAQRQGLAFIDADNEIQEAAGCSIEDIFETQG